MVEWSDDAIVMGCKIHGEKNAVVEVMTPEHGRFNALVRSGMSSTLRPLLQVGNSLRVLWRARLEEQLGTFNVEALRIRTDRFLHVPHALHLLNVCSTLIRLLPERVPHTNIYHALHELCDNAHHFPMSGFSLVRFEMLILQELGFGLDLTCCAATGKTQELIYVSPKSAQAVSADAGEPYRAKLLRLPPFLRETSHASQSQILAHAHDIKNSELASEAFDGFALTGFFLERHVFEPRGMVMSDSRARIVNGLKAG